MKLNDFVDSSKAIQGSSEDDEAVKLARSNRKKYKAKYDQEQEDEAEPTLPTTLPTEELPE